MQLADYMRENDLSDFDVAEAIGVARATISRLRRRKERPSWQTVERIKEYSDGIVTADDWLANNISYTRGVQD